MRSSLHTKPSQLPNGLAMPLPKKGSALIAVFWIMAVLSLAVFSAVRVVYYDADVASAQINGFEALQAAERGIAVAVNPSIRKLDPLLEWSDPERDISYSARFSSEGARFNINGLLLTEDKQLLVDIFTDWEMPLEDAQMLVDNLKDWVDRGEDVELNGAEATWYEQEGRNNHPFNRPFYNLDEMLLVKDINLLLEVRPDWREWFTVWSSGLLDINEASADLISVAMEISIDDATDLVERILGPDLIRDTEDDVRFESVREAGDFLGLSDFQQEIIQGRITTEDPVTRVISDGRAGTVKRRITLVLRGRDDQLIILERKEEILP